VSNAAIDVHNAEVPNCPRCGGPGLISAQIPVSTWSDGTPLQIPCHAVVILCPACDIGSPEAGALIAFFAVHGCVSDETIEEFGRLLQAWTTVVQPPVADPERVEAEYQLWRAGEL
jgi:Family of unknown function (DUF6300)